MSKTFFVANDPKEIEFTLSVTMTLGQWMEISKALENGGQSYHYGAAGELWSGIHSMVIQAGRVYEPKTEASERILAPAKVKKVKAVEAAPILDYIAEAGADDGSGAGAHG